MTFEKFMMQLKRNLLCDTRERKPSLDIGEPTDVRVIDVSDALPGLTDAQRKQIKEEVSSGALRLQSIQSQPHKSPPAPTEPDTHHSSVITKTVESPSTNTKTISHYSFADTSPEEPPIVAPNTIPPKLLPAIVSTSPRRKQKRHSPPATRMKSMWNSDRPYSSDSSGKLEVSRPSFIHETGLVNGKSGIHSPQTLNIREGDHVQDSAHDVRGAREERSMDAENAAVRRAGRDVEDVEVVHD